MPPLRPQLTVHLFRYTRLQRLYSTSERTLKVTSIPAPHAGSIKILSSNRPQARNAISKQLSGESSREVEASHEEGEKGPTRASVSASECDNAFCAGADLKERLGFTKDETTTFLTALRRTLTRLSHLPIPTITALHSSAFGGGLELALTTHFRVFASTAAVASPETKLAIIPGAGGTYRLPASIGSSRARDMVLTGRVVRGPEAYFLGLCERLVEVPQPEGAEMGAVDAEARKRTSEAAVGSAREICDGGPVAVRAAMEAVERCAEGPAAEERAYERVSATEDRVEALRAFGEKRRPVFKGR